MAVIWGLPTWVWVAVGGVAFAACLVIARVLGAVFSALGDLRASLELSQRLLTSAIQATQADAERARSGLARLGDRDADAPDEAYTDW